jgi:hypothetical protein
MAFSQVEASASVASVASVRTRNGANRNQSLPFTRVVHKVVTLDAQPASATVASILVLVTGQLIVDDGSNILQFSQMFQVSSAEP